MPKGHQPSKRKSQKGCQHKLNGGGGCTNDSNQPNQSNQPKPSTTGSSKENQSKGQYLGGEGYGR